MMKALRSFLIAMTFFALVMPIHAHAQKVTITEVKAKPHPFKGEEFLLHFKFDLPDFDGAESEQVHIDHATLTFEIIVESVDSTSINMVETLAAASNGKEPKPGLAYNDHPVTARARRTRLGTEQVRVDITQLVDHWVHRGLENDGVILLSHRLLGKNEKIFRPGKVRVSANFEPSVTIFYTILDE